MKKEKKQKRKKEDVEYGREGKEVTRKTIQEEIHREIRS